MAGYDRKKVLARPTGVQDSRKINSLKCPTGQKSAIYNKAISYELSNPGGSPSYQRGETVRP